MKRIFVPAIITIALLFPGLAYSRDPVSEWCKQHKTGAHAAELHANAENAMACQICVWQADHGLPELGSLNNETTGYVKKHVLPRLIVEGELIQCAPATHGVVECELIRLAFQTGVTTGRGGIAFKTPKPLTPEEQAKALAVERAARASAIAAARDRLGDYDRALAVVGTRIMGSAFCPDGMECEPHDSGQRNVLALELGGLGIQGGDFGDALTAGARFDWDLKDTIITPVFRLAVGRRNGDAQPSEGTRAMFCGNAGVGWPTSHSHSITLAVLAGWCAREDHDFYHGTASGRWYPHPRIALQAEVMAGAVLSETRNPATDAVESDRSFSMGGSAALVIPIDL